MLPANHPAVILSYLRENLPSYPFEESLDEEFVEELICDFQEIDILEQVKRFRWYYDNAPTSRVRNVRVALRRWVLLAWNRQTP